MLAGITNTLQETISKTPSPLHVRAARERLSLIARRDSGSASSRPNESGRTSSSEKGRCVPAATPMKAAATGSSIGRVAIHPLLLCDGCLRDRTVPPRHQPDIVLQTFVLDPHGPCAQRPSSPWARWRTTDRSVSGSAAGSARLPPVGADRAGRPGQAAGKRVRRQGPGSRYRRPRPGVRLTAHPLSTLSVPELLLSPSPPAGGGQGGTGAALPTAPTKRDSPWPTHSPEPVDPALGVGQDRREDPVPTRLEGSAWRYRMTWSEKSMRSGSRSGAGTLGLFFEVELCSHACWYSPTICSRDSPTLACDVRNPWTEVRAPSPQH
ncbi:hypothetical protein SO3561_08113 [Streptomyces olivochromogenes]|uniref:Uncharacterized protein n=1 Tax=Streptomyces olivochromogenes TaxID=1963 RepID=A0A250VQX4_STROL|nr:hypothetical protein SO3561_08113 [Streptomyces olivochromogenes]